MTLASRLPDFETEALLSLQVNARRLSAQPGMRGEEAEQLLPLIDAELAKRVKPAPVRKPRVAKKA